MYQHSGFEITTDEIGRIENDFEMMTIQETSQHIHKG